MEDNERKRELATFLAITASTESLIRSYLDKSTVLFSLIVKPGEAAAKKDKIKKAFDDAINDIMEHIVQTIQDGFTLKELEKLNLIMKDPIFVRFNNFWMEEKATDILFAIANKRAEKLVDELNELFPAPGVPITKELPKDKSQLN